MFIYKLTNQLTNGGDNMPNITVYLENDLFFNFDKLTYTKKREIKNKIISLIKEEMK